MWCKQESGSGRVSFSQADTHVGESKTTQSNIERVCGEKNHQIHVETANLGTRLGFKPPDISLLIAIPIILCVCVCICVRVCVPSSFFFFWFCLLSVGLLS